MSVTFELQVTAEFWDQARTWPAGCRPIIFSTDAVMHNRGTVRVPASCADEVERRLRAHSEVIAIVRVLPGRQEQPRRLAA